MKRITDHTWNNGMVEGWRRGTALRTRSFPHSFIASSLVFAFSLMFFSCNKNAGLGGNATLTVHGAHHSNTIVNLAGYPDTVFLKYNVDEYPGSRPSDYDSYFIGTPPDDFVKIDGLKKGKYFVYMVGFDSAWGAAGARVTGGMALTIKRSQKDDEIMIHIPLSE